MIPPPDPSADTPCPRPEGPPSPSLPVWPPRQLARTGALVGLWPLVSVQALVAATVAAGLQRALVAADPSRLLAAGGGRAHGAGIHPGWYLAAFVILVLVY